MKLKAPGNFNLANPTSWPKQAKLVVANRMEDLNALQENLIGGRIKK